MVVAPPHGAAFEAAIQVTPIDSHQYSAYLQHEWCIGAVPHGGYSSAIIYRLALTHFAHTHPQQYRDPATPISMQLTFLRRTAVGPALLNVQDVKIGARTSTIHVTLSQSKNSNMKTQSQTGEEEQEVKIAGYITVSPAHAEIGLTAPTGWMPLPEPARGSQPDRGVNLVALGEYGRDGEWKRIQLPFPEFRRATQHVDLYGPRQPQSMAAVDQWARFRPGGDQMARWSNEAVVYLTDTFPLALSGLDRMAVTAEGDGKIESRHWYPTVVLNIDFKKRLPATGETWLYSRVQTVSVREGRTDLGVIILDATGQVVAMATQVGLVVSASRNLGNRSKL
ncbi:thioesterase family protein [Aspergillus saccharolyticus JOP 1030-1]|uniref:Thioesterase family protein n=1 Tax=Aspergillus saccharolyticus JOP 1030-1 TaxID=1450539 RepID=A0A319A8M6_9EURO|nr:hypothetical protein BP01DRAFT_358684 [Aspergillus saccharolyticus JOP 1030-1]PYH43432.1 hypothetical protein BP01DRAFT_358684 [Aspergillus saccharolyticus JOP 1030-1]